jgi:hypothetical protein
MRKAMVLIRKAIAALEGMLSDHMRVSPMSIINDQKQSYCAAQ